MSGEVEVSSCNICHDKQVTVQREYYYYDVNCDCCGGKQHFHIVRHCERCKPLPPTVIRVVLEKSPVDRA